MSLSGFFGIKKDKSSKHSSSKPVYRASDAQKSNTNPFSQPPAYQPVGHAASYYGNTPQPQYPPVPVGNQNPYNGAPGFQGPPPGFQAPMGAQQAPPVPGINPSNTLPLPSMNPAQGADDPYTFLREFDTILLVDDSGSMSGGRWRQTSEALSTIIPIVTFYDSDGIDLHFLNAPDSPFYHNIKTPAQIMEIFGNINPRGATPTGKAIRRITAPQLAKLESRKRVKPMNIIVITDGVPTDDLESEIIDVARKLDRMGAEPNQIGIQFFQIGNDAEATEALRELDDVLSKEEGIRDIVDTVPFRGSLQGDAMLKVVLGAVNRRLDRKKL